MKNKKYLLVIILFLTAAANQISGQWVIQISNTTQHLQKIANFSSLPISIAVGTGGTILKTTNDGTNWISITNPASTTLTDIFPIGSSTAYASGSGIVLKTTNGGSNWTATGTVPNRFFNAIFFFNENTGWACGQTDTIIKTTNGGANWNLLENNQIAGENNSGIFFLNVLQGYMTGSSDGTTGYMLRTINGGANWVQVLTNTDAIQCVEMKNSSTGYAGSLGKIFKTTNGGSNWTGVSIGNNGSVMDLHFPVDEQTGFAVTAFGKILKTTNAGVNWYLLTSPTGNILRGIKFKFSSNTTGYIVGNAGTILRTTNGGGAFVGVTPGGNIIPDKYSLNQNYPNPFNPVTSISFALPQAENVKLIVYDILGNEIAVLVNGHKQAGVHNIEFNAENYSSGIYFYRLLTESYSETRKMSLIK